MAVNRPVVKPIYRTIPVGQKPASANIDNLAVTTRKGQFLVTVIMQAQLVIL